MKMPPILYVSRLLPQPVMEAIEQRFRLSARPQREPPTREKLLSGIRDADAAITTLTEQVDDAVLEAAPGLRVIANYAVGYNNIAVDRAKARGVTVTNTPDVLTEATADLTWGLLLAAARRLTEGQQLVQSGRWTGWEPGQLLGLDVYEKSLGIIGMGRIGQAVARRALGFGMTIRYFSRRVIPFPALPSPSASSPALPWEPVSLDELLGQSDFVTLHVPLGPDTVHLIDANALRKMKPTAILLNTCRGPVVDEAALVNALREGRLAGAGLDVYEREPHLASGLRELPQVVTLPHLGSATHSTRTRMGMMCVDNVLAVLEGRPAPNAVL